MFTKTLKIKWRNIEADVLVFLDSDMVDRVIVTMKSMCNEYFLEDQVTFTSRDAAYDFIKHFTTNMAKAFFIREAYNTEAIH